MIEQTSCERRARRNAAETWRANRILRFTERQRVERNWIRLSELAERYGRERSTTEAYQKLYDAIMAGDFETAGRSRLLYLHPATALAKMTRNKIAGYPKDYAIKHYVEPSWAPKALAVQWCEVNNVSTLGWLDFGVQPPKQARGRKIQFDWPDAKDFAFRLLGEQGAFRDWDIGSDWQAQADLERKILAYMEKSLGEGDGPAESTLRKYVSGWLKEWKAIN